MTVISRKSLIKIAIVLAAVLVVTPFVLWQVQLNVLESERASLGQVLSIFYGIFPSFILAFIPSVMLLTFIIALSVDYNRNRVKLIDLSNLMLSVGYTFFAYWYTGNLDISIFAWPFIFIILGVACSVLSITICLSRDRPGVPV